MPKLKYNVAGRSRGGFSTKIHLICDRLGHPLHVHVTAGQVHEAVVLDEIKCSFRLEGTKRKDGRRYV